jgi:hypothetical protein
MISCHFRSRSFTVRFLCALAIKQAVRIRIHGRFKSSDNELMAMVHTLSSNWGATTSTPARGSHRNGNEGGTTVD